MTRPPVFRDRRGENSGWRVEARSLGLLVIACFVVAFVLLAFALGCAPVRELPPPCPAIQQLMLEGKLKQVQAGCDDDPMGECPGLVKEYEAKIEAVPDEACP